MKRYISAANVRLTENEKANYARKSANSKLLARLALTAEYNRELVQNENTPRNVLSYIAKHPKDKYGYVEPRLLAQILCHPNCSEEIKQYILNSDYIQNWHGDDLDCKFADGLAKGTDDEALIRWMCSFDQGRRSAARYADIFPEGLAVDIGLCPDPTTRRYAAGNPNMASDVLEILAYAPEPDIRRDALFNPKLSDEVFAEALDDSPSEVFRGMYKDISDMPEQRVHLLISHLLSLVNNGCGADADLALTLRHSMVSGALSQSEIEDIASADFDSRAYSQLILSSLPDDVLNILEDHFVSRNFNTGDISDWVLANTLLKCTNAEFLSKCAGDSRWEVREAVANNTNTPADVLRKLATETKSGKVREAAKHTLAKLNIPLEAPAAVAPATRKINSRSWSVPVYLLDSYASIAPELDDVIRKTVKNAGWDTDNARVKYAFDTGDYDTADTFTIRKNGQQELTCDAQMFLATLTSVQSKPASIDRGVVYLNKAYRSQHRG